jgi:hypothetical protein
MIEMRTYVPKGTKTEYSHNRYDLVEVRAGGAGTHEDVHYLFLVSRVEKVMRHEKQTYKGLNMHHIFDFAGNKLA